MTEMVYKALAKVQLLANCLKQRADYRLFRIKKKNRRTTGENKKYKLEGFINSKGMASPKTVTSHQRPLEFHELANTSFKAHFLCAAYITDRGLKYAFEHFSCYFLIPEPGMFHGFPDPCSFRASRLSFSHLGCPTHQGCPTIHP